MARILPIVCQFGIGALLCAVGVWAGWRSGYLTLSNREDRRIVIVIAAGFLGLLALSCAFTFWLPYVGGGAAQ